MSPDQDEDLFAPQPPEISGDFEDDARTKEPVSERKKEANRENAQLSTGPRSSTGKEVVSKNAIKHGLRGKTLEFRDDEERNYFQELASDLETELQPVGILERQLAEEIAVCLWKSAISDGWLMQELYVRRTAAAAVLDVFINSSKTAGNPFSRQDNEVGSAARAGWECRELVVSMGGQQYPERFLSKDNTQVQFQAKLGASGDTIFRYQNAWKRDLHRAIETLTRLQQARKAAAKAEPAYA
jgi:hypothetical protein